MAIGRGLPFSPLSPTTKPQLMALLDHAFAIPTAVAALVPGLVITRKDISEAVSPNYYRRDVLLVIYYEYRLNDGNSVTIQSNVSAELDDQLRLGHIPTWVALFEDVAVACNKKASEDLEAQLNSIYG